MTDRVVSCPNCGCKFGFDIDAGEEVLGDVRIVRKSIERASWSELSAAIRRGESARFISVGDSIPITLKNGKQVVAVAAHENPYWENSMAFVLADCLDDAHRMNPTHTNRGGYPASEMRKYLTEEILPLLPDELVAVLKPRKIIQNFAGQRYECEDLLTIPSYTEVFGRGNGIGDTDSGDVHFDLFKTQKSRVKGIGNETRYWWLRSPVFDYFFYLVHRYGDCAYCNRAGYEYGVVPSFYL